MPLCSNCKTPTTNKIGLRILCSIDCALAFTKAKQAKKLERIERDLRKAERTRTKADKERIKSLGTLCAEARKVVQEYARVRDEVYGRCVCCNVAKIEHGGHFFAVGSKYRCARLSLDVRQIHGCCVKCNVFVGGGNNEGYTRGLTERYGVDYLAMLAELKRNADDGTDLPLTKEEVHLIKTKYRNKIKELRNKSVS